MSNADDLFDEIYLMLLRKERFDSNRRSMRVLVGHRQREELLASIKALKHVTFDVEMAQQVFGAPLLFVDKADYLEVVYA